MSIKGRIGIQVADRTWLNEASSKYHYMHKALPNRSLFFGWAVSWDGNTHNTSGEAYGFIIYSLIHFQRLKGEFGFPGLPTHWQVLCMSRLWLHDDMPRNSETWVIGSTLRLVQRRWIEVHPPVYTDQPYHIVKIISYCDNKLFAGTVYRAANFRRHGETETRSGKVGSRGSNNRAAMTRYVYDLKEPRWEYLGK